MADLAPTLYDVTKYSDQQLSDEYRLAIRSASRNPPGSVERADWATYATAIGTEQAARANSPTAASSIMQAVQDLPQTIDNAAAGAGAIVGNALGSGIKGFFSNPVMLAVGALAIYFLMEQDKRVR